MLGLRDLKYPMLFGVGVFKRLQKDTVFQVQGLRLKIEALFHQVTASRCERRLSST